MSKLAVSDSTFEARHFATLIYPGNYGFGSGSTDRMLASLCHALSATLTEAFFFSDVIMYLRWFR